MKNLLLAVLLLFVFASCKTVSLQQEMTIQNGQPVKVGSPTLLKRSEGDRWFRVYRTNSKNYKK